MSEETNKLAKMVKSANLGINTARLADALRMGVVSPETNALAEFVKTAPVSTIQKNKLVEALMSGEPNSESNRLAAALLGERSVETENDSEAFSSLREARKNPFTRSEQFTAYFNEKETELQQFRASLQEQYAQREKALHKEITNREKALQDREAMLRKRYEETEAHAARLSDERAVLMQKLERMAIEHKNAISDLERQKEQYKEDFQQRIELKANEYVDVALASLAVSEQRFDRTGQRWSISGAIAILAGLVFAAALGLEATKELILNKEIAWILLLFFSVKGAVILGLVYGVVRFCARLGRSYMHESLKNAERRHAINYGKFYLSVYGAGSDWDKVKDAFAHWNISGLSAFSDTAKSSSAQSLGEMVKDLVPAIRTSVTEKK